MNLFGWFGSGTEETKEDDNDNVTINNNDEMDLLNMPNSFFQQPRREGEMRIQIPSQRP